MENSDGFGISIPYAAVMVPLFCIYPCGRSKMVEDPPSRVEKTAKLDRSLGVLLPPPPEIPEVPLDPLIPEVPEVNPNADVPLDPLTPDVPDDPSTPDVPDVPLTPEVPEDPVHLGLVDLVVHQH